LVETVFREFALAFSMFRRTSGSAGLCIGHNGDGSESRKGRRLSGIKAYQTINPNEG
jgi:hypothetical protein